MQRYEIIIYWNDEDKVFVADVPELPGCMAHGPTEELALRIPLRSLEILFQSLKGVV